MNNQPNNKKNQADPDEKVANMNAIFDKYIVPVILFTLAVILIFGVAPKLFSCSGKDQSTVSEQTETLDFYRQRADLLSDADSSMTAFESAGFTLVDNESTGYAAYKLLDSGVEIMDNLSDSNGNLFSAVISPFTAENGTQGEVTVMIYSGSLFLVSVTCGDDVASAIFCDDQFLSFTSGSDAEAAAVLGYVSRDKLSDMITQYIQSIESVIEAK